MPEREGERERGGGVGGAEKERETERLPSEQTRGGDGPAGGLAEGDNGGVDN